MGKYQRLADAKTAVNPTRNARPRLAALLAQRRIEKPYRATRTGPHNDF
jgi:hypothetical protein